MVNLFENGFPKELRTDMSVVEKYISGKTYNNIKNGQTEELCTYILQNGETVSFPYRIYYIEDNVSVLSELTQTQRIIYHAVYTRSCDGFVREKHLKELFESEMPEWIYPYILKLSDEYVIEIVECIYGELCLRNTDLLKKFCFLNLNQFLKSHARMISYWNEYHRNRCYRYRNYVGRRLFKECFGYSRRLEKLRKVVL